MDTLERWSPAIFWSACSALFLVYVSAYRDNLILLGAIAAIALVSSIGVYRRRRAHFELLSIKDRFGAKVAADTSTVLGAGLTPKGSGTVGAIAALPLTYYLAQLELLIRVPILIAMTGLSVYATARYLDYEKRFLDPKEVVVDELVGV